MNLYELTLEFAQLQMLMEDPDVNQQKVFDAMEALEGEIEYKADGYAKVIRNMEANVEAIKAEMQRLTKNKMALENNIARLKDNLHHSMVTTGKKKFKTDLFSFSIQKNGGADPVVVDVATEDLPDDLVIVTEKPDLKAIAAYIKETGDISYAHFGERGESLRIK